MDGKHLISHAVSLTLLNSRDINLDTLSVWITLGNPTLAKKLIIASTTFFVEMTLSGIAFGNLVALHIIVRMYLFPILVLSSGPTQSIIIRSNGSPVVGMGFNGAGGIV